MTIAPSHINDSAMLAADELAEEISISSAAEKDEIDKSELLRILLTIVKELCNGREIPCDIASGSFG